MRAIALIFLLAVNVRTASAGNEARDIQPTPSVQDALHSYEVAKADQEWRQKTRPAFEKAMKLCGNNRQTLLLQAIYYSAQAGPGQERRANMDVAVAMKLGFSKKELLECLIPYGDSEDSKVQASIYRYLLGPQLTIEEIDGIIASNKEHPPRYLIESYYSDPSWGLRRMVRIYSNETTNAEQVLQLEQVTTELLQLAQKHGLDSDQRAQAVANLQKLGDHSEWWVRLYVAAVMRREKAFRDQKLLKKLLKDDYTLVRKLAEASGQDGREP